MAKPQIFYGWINVAILFTLALFIWGPHYSYGVFFKPLASEFSWSRTEVSAAMTINLMVGGLLGFFAGTLSDRYGAKKVMYGSALFIGAGYLLLTQLGSLWQLYLWFGLIVGIGTSTAYIVPAATVSRWFVAKRGLGLSITLMGMGLAQVLPPPAIATAIGWYGWRSTYLIIAVTLTVLIFTLASFLKNSPEDYGMQPDGVRKAQDFKPSGSKVTLEGFTIKESIRLPAFWLLLLLWLLLALPVFVALVHVVPMATDAGIDPVSAATIISFMGLAGIAGRLVFGYSCDRWGCRAIGTTCFILFTMSMIGLAFARTLPVFYVTAIFFGATYTGADTALVKMVGDFFGRRYVGGLMGLLALGWRIGASSGALIGGLAYDITGRYQSSFAIGASSGVIAAILMFIIFKYKPAAFPGYSQSQNV
ncbi:MAG: MFS transporter [Dehalococcoidia bacterium]|nr:MFS transporter [Dehalococcoidia bacterium]MDZ4246267.1 MFS transporter [Dehalococcoidia bacterium]